MLNEFQARIYVADKVMDLGRGGIRYLSALTGLSRTTIPKAVGELESGRKWQGPLGSGARQPGGRTQETGGGRPPPRPGMDSQRGGQHRRGSDEPVALD